MILNMKILNGIASIVSKKISILLAATKLEIHCWEPVRLTVIVLHVHHFAPCLGGVKCQPGMEENQKLKLNVKN